MTASLQNYYDFFKDAALAASSSLDLSKALRTFFDFASRHFPLEGLSLHKYEPRLKSIRLLFLVTKNDYIFLDQLIPMSKEGERTIALFENTMSIQNIPSTINRPVGGRHGMALKDYLPLKDRAYLLANLSANAQTIGRLCLMGKATNCFTKIHEEKLDLLKPLMSMVMMNLLQYHQTIELQKKLNVQHQQISGEMTLLKNSSVIIGQEGLRKTMKMVRQLAGEEIPVLIQGETGTGKELIADAVQRISLRKNGPYIKVNCGAIPESLVDSELFGYRKGAFTGAIKDRAGRFEQANGGTLFLDEIGDLPLQLQVRLLRVLQNGVIERLGSNSSISVDVRVIAATHRPLEKMLKERTFRQDLYYRLNAFPLTIPPLRKRIQDLPVLVYHFIKKAAQKMNISPLPKLAEGAMEKLKAYAWPGNVRELQNLIERAIILEPDGQLELERYLPIDTAECAPLNAGNEDLEALVDRRIEANLKKRLVHMPDYNKDPDNRNKNLHRPLLTLDQAMTEHINNALNRSKGKIHGPGGAAEILGIHPSTLCKRMDKLGIAYGRKKLCNAR